MASGSYVDLPVSDGSSMRAYVASPAAGGAHPAIMVFQEAFGVNSHIRDVTDRFAGEGYLAMAPELFHRTGTGFEGAYGDFDAVRPHMEAVNQDGLQADVKACCDWLGSQGTVDSAKICCVGYCMGGRVSYLANATVPLKAAISFYGGGIATGLLGLTGKLAGPILLFWGGLDRHIGVDQIRAVEDSLREAGKTYANVVFSDADHGYFCDARPSYNPRAARESWALALAFLKDHLG